MPPTRIKPVRIAPKPLPVRVRPGSQAPDPLYETPSHDRPILPRAGEIFTFSQQNSNFNQPTARSRIEQLRASTGGGPHDQHISLVQADHGTEAPAVNHRPFFDLPPPSLGRQIATQPLH